MGDGHRREPGASRVASKQYRYLVLPLAVLAYWIGLVPSNEDLVQTPSVQIVSGIGLFTTVIFPALLLLVAKLRGLGSGQGKGQGKVQGSGNRGDGDRKGQKEADR